MGTLFASSTWGLFLQVEETLHHVAVQWYFPSHMFEWLVSTELQVRLPGGPGTPVLGLLVHRVLVCRVYGHASTYGATPEFCHL
jgi:hypothetical protein